jgi:predicted CXXCH cytochrome family protein
MEWLLVSGLVVFGLIAVAKQRGRQPPRAIYLVLTAAVVAALCGWAWNVGATRKLGDIAFRETALPREGRPEDGFVSSDRCAACHPDQYESWHRSYHRTMTQWVRPETVRANFNNQRLESRGATYHLRRAGDEYWAEFANPDGSRGGAIGSPAAPEMVSRRIGMLTGSHHMQVFWIPTARTNVQITMPFAYLLEDQRWAPLGDTFLRDPNLEPVTGLWNGNCIECHTTAGQPKPDNRSGGADTRVGELGIACESCHGPGEEHAKRNANPLRRYALHQQSKKGLASQLSVDPTIANPAKLAPKTASQVCGQCHSIKWIANKADYNANGIRYRPGQELSETIPVVQPTLRTAMPPDILAGLRRTPSFLPEHYWIDGKVRVSGRDYNGLVDAPCYQRGDLSCLSCHSLHHSNPNNQLAANMESNEACLQCHKEFRGKLAAHTHHAANSSGSLCYDCHMARTTYGLLKAIRNHYIESPSAQTSAKTGRPNGCNLCHLDRSLGWTSDKLVEWYGSKPANLTDEQRTVSAAALWALRGDAGQRALIAWHFGWGPALKASGDKWEAPYLAQLLVDPYSVVRYIAARSLRRLPGFGDFDYDFLASPSDRDRARDRAFSQWRQNGAPARPAPELLLDATGALQTDRFANFLSQRDDKSMDLQE